MALASLTIQMDADLKKKMEDLCDDLGMSLATAFTVFAKKATREYRIPFELDADPVYKEVITEEEFLRRIKAMDAGKCVEHELIEADE